MLGPTGSARIDTLVHDLVEHSERAGDIVQGKSVGRAMLSLRSFMFERVYLAPSQREHHQQAMDVIRRLMDHHLVHPEDVPASYRDNDADRVTQAADYVAGMTDRYALRVHQWLFGAPGMEDPRL